VAGALALPVAAKAGGFARDVLEQAIAARGGRARIARIKALNWTGKAIVAIADDKTLEIRVKTRVEPFGRARSESWIPASPDPTPRTMTIRPEGGFVDYKGIRRALPAAQTEHERQQYAIYGYMLYARAPAEFRMGAITTQREDLPRMLWFPDGITDDIQSGVYEVTNPEGTGIIEELITFSGDLVDKGIHWPQTIVIAQHQKPYFTLALDSFSVELA